MGVRSDTVDAKYIFEFEVGIWPLGTVQVLKDRATGELRSCKTVRKAILQDAPAAVGRLARLRKLSHPHINSIVDVIEDNLHIFIITEKTDGNDMMEWLERTLDEGNWIQEHTCAFYLHQALTAVAHCHAFRIYHGDLRPNSLLLTTKLPDANVRVTDFGLSPVLDPSRSSLMEAPPPFSAPELREGHGGDFAAMDMWSLGAVAHTLLVGKPPSKKTTTTSTWTRLAGFDAEDAASWAERSPESWDFVRRLLREDPAQRPTAARALRHPWLRGAAAAGLGADSGRRMLCYMLSVLLLPEDMDFKSLHQLRKAFEAADSDRDGLVLAPRAQELLQKHGFPQKTAASAVTVADALGCGSLDLCGFAVAGLLAMTAGGDAAQGAKDLAPRLLKRLFAVYGDPGNALVGLSQLRNRLCTATGREVETRAGVNFDEILEGFPENSVLNSQMLIQEFSSCGGRGTPLEEDDEPATAAAADEEGGLFSMRVGLDGLDGLFEQLFQSCGRCAQDERHTPRAAVVHRGARWRGV